MSARFGRAIRVTVLRVHTRAALRLCHGEHLLRVCVFPEVSGVVAGAAAVQSTADSVNPPRASFLGPGEDLTIEAMHTLLTQLNNEQK